MENNKSRKKPYTPSELESRARASAEKHKDIANHPNVGAHIQWEEFKKAKIRPTTTQLQSNTCEGLMGQLEDYVGAKGRYTAYTKSVVLYLNEEGLKDIEVVDTPGVNDPVKSREQRTNEFLRDCNVILAVSPASNFLDEKDAAFIGNAMSVGGVGECYLIASRCDDTLLEKVDFSSPKSPFDLLNELNQELGLNGRCEEASWKEEEIEDKQTKEKIKQKVKLFTAKDFTTSSSVAFSLLQHLNQQTKLDEIAEHTFGQLKSNFSTTFRDQQKAKEFLTALTGLNNIEGTFSRLRKEKDKILEKQAQNFENPIKHRLRNHLEAILKDVPVQINKLDLTNLESAKKREAFLNEISPTISFVADNAFQRTISELGSEVGKELIRKNNQLFDAFSTSDSKEIKTKIVKDKKTERVKKSYVGSGLVRFFSGDNWGWEVKEYTVDRTVSYVQYKTTPICDSIDSVRKSIESNLAKTASSVRSRWGNIALNTVGQELFDKLSNIPGGKKEIDPDDITNIINGIINNLPNISFKLKPKPEIFNQYVTLDEYEGERFIEQAQQYMKTLQREVEVMINHYASMYVKAMESQEVGAKLTASLKQEAEVLIKNIQNKEEIISKYNKLVENANKLNAQIVISEANEENE